VQRYVSADGAAAPGARQARRHVVGEGEGQGEGVAARDGARADRRSTPHARRTAAARTPRTIRSTRSSSRASRSRRRRGSCARSTR
jgi:hypothetical protein